MTDERILFRLKKANALLRSAHSIAKRKGEKVNWQAFEDRLYAELIMQNAIINPPTP